MNSIDKNQREDNYENLTGQQAIDRIKDFVKKAETCFFVTERPTGGSHGVRPMAARKVDDQGNLWFLSADDSHKNEELQRDSSVRLYFQGSPHSDFMYLTGKVAITRDKAIIKELWSPIIKTWFTEGIDDPRITVLQFIPQDGYYWDTKHGTAVAGVKMAIGALIGKTMDDSIQGKIAV